MPVQKCRVPECNRPRHALGLCRTCGDYVLHGKDANVRARIAKYRLPPRDKTGPRGPYKVKPSPICLVPGCENPELVRGLCNACSQYIRVGRDQAKRQLIAQYQLPAHTITDGRQYSVVGSVAGVCLVGATVQEYEGGLLLARERGGQRRLYISPTGKLNWVRAAEKSHEPTEFVSKDDTEPLDSGPA